MRMRILFGPIDDLVRGVDEIPHNVDHPAKVEGQLLIRNRWWLSPVPSKQPSGHRSNGTRIQRNVATTSSQIFPFLNNQL
jgi:hypothetical protein